MDPQRGCQLGETYLLLGDLTPAKRAKEVYKLDDCPDIHQPLRLQAFLRFDQVQRTYNLSVDNHPDNCNACQIFDLAFHICLFSIRPLGLSILAFT